MKLLKAVLGYGVLVAGLLFPVLFGGDILFPLHTDQMEPWRSETSAERLTELDLRGNPALSDMNFLFHPDTSLMVREWKQGHLPLWNPYLLGGASQLGQALLGAYYPPHALFLLSDSPVPIYGWLVALHVVFACVGMFWFLRMRELSPAAAWIGGLAFGLAGPLAVRYQYYCTLYPVVWIPWLLGLVHRFTERPTGWRWSLLSVPVAMVILSGFPQTGVYGVYFAAIYGAVRIVRGGVRPLPRLMALGAGFAVAAPLCAAQLWPVVDTQSRSLSRERSFAEQSSRGGSPWLPAGYLMPASFVDPVQNWSLDWTTNPLWGALYLRSERTDEGDIDLRPLSSRPNITEDTCYAGALVLLFAAAGLFQRRRREAWALGAAGGLCWAYALGFAPVVWTAYYGLPGTNIGDVRRILPTLALLTAWLAALGVERLGQEPRALRVPLLAGVLSLFGLTSLAVVLWHWGPEGWFEWLDARIQSRFDVEFPWTDEQRATTPAMVHDFVASRCRESLAWMFGAVIVLGAWALLWRRSSVVALAIASTFVTADLGRFYHSTNTSVQAEEFLRRPEWLEPLFQRAEDGRIHRLLHDSTQLDPTRDLLLSPNLAMHFGLFDSQGYIVAVPERFARYMKKLQGESAVTTVMVHPMTDREALSSPLLDLASVRFLLARSDLDPALTTSSSAAGWQPFLQHGRWSVLENTEARPFVTIWPEAKWITPGEDLAASHASILDELASSNAFDAVFLEGSGEARPASGTPSSVRSVRREPSSCTIQLEPGDGGYLVWNEGFDPGWEATVDGIPTVVHPANVAFQGIELPAGAKHVQFRYRPTPVRGGLWISLVTSALLAGVSVTTWVRHRRSSATPLSG